MSDGRFNNSPVVVRPFSPCREVEKRKRKLFVLFVKEREMVAIFPP